MNAKLGQRGAYDSAVELAGAFIEKLSMDMRFTFANMGTETGAVTSYIQPDAITRAWVDRHGTKPTRCTRPIGILRTTACTKSTFRGIEPQLAIPHAPDNVKPVTAVAGRKVDQAYIGSCASGRLEDLAAAARVLRGRRVHPDVRLIVTPGSREVLIAATAAGYI